MAKGILSKIKQGMTKTRDALSSRVDELISYYKEIDDDFFDDLEDILISSDMGTKTSLLIVEEVRERVKKEKIGHPERIKELMRDAIISRLNNVVVEDIVDPSIILMVGVNGVGKTTTTGKLAAMLSIEGHKVMLSAADTFRAAAAEQLSEWAVRADVPIIKHGDGADPAAVIFDSITSAKARGMDVLICDTAGRLHNKKNLMNELSKMSRIIKREWPEAKKEVFLVMDATTGQNGVSQAKLFSQVVDISGIILTKLDGTAKGGVAISMSEDLGVPIKYICIGEGLNDIQLFDPLAYAQAII